MHALKWFCLNRCCIIRSQNGLNIRDITAYSSLNLWNKILMVKWLTHGYFSESICWNDAKWVHISITNFVSEQYSPTIIIIVHTPKQSKTIKIFSLQFFFFFFHFFLMYHRWPPVTFEKDYLNEIVIVNIWNSETLRWGATIISEKFSTGAKGNFWELIEWGHVPPLDSPPSLSDCWSALKKWTTKINKSYF